VFFTLSGYLITDILGRQWRRAANQARRLLRGGATAAAPLFVMLAWSRSG